jgi:glyoxalase-like protein
MKKCVMTSIITLVSLMATGRAAPRGSDNVLAQVDHLVYATPDLKVGMDTLERLLGVRATLGGQHPGLGTRNALIALGSSSYIEIIGPDPEQAKPNEPRRFGIDDLKVPRLVTWVAKGTQLERLAADARLHGMNLGQVSSGSRKRLDGVVLSWRYTDPSVVIADRIVPYFIDWGTTPHPALTAANGATLIGLRAEHPDVRRVRNMLDQLGLHLPIQQGATPALIATLSSPKGRIELRN